MTAPATPGTSPWFDEGLRAGAALDDASSVLVAGRDGEAAAWVALGIARAQSARRRVAVADLVGDAAALAVPGADDAPGIADSLTYGVSLNKIARAVDDGEQLFVLPSGSEPVATERIFRSDRWRRLASGFREVGALLVLAARADTPGLDALAASVEGVIVAGDLGGALPEMAPPLAVLALPAAARRGRLGRLRTAPTPTTAVPATPDEPTASSDPRRAPTAPRGEMRLLDPDARPSSPRGAFGSPRDRLVVLGVAALTVGAAALLWLVPHGLGTGVQPPPSRTVAKPARPASPPQTPPSTSVTPTPATATPNPATREPSVQRLVVANPADSAAAATYAVYVVGSNTPDGASVDWRVDRTPPVLALTPVLQDNEPSYRLIVGAYRTRAQADSLLHDLQRRGVLGEESGRVVRAPYALLIEARVPAAEAARRVQALAARGIPTYPLSRGDGTVGLFAGAFETADEAAYLARTARAAGVTATLVYRTGGAL